MARKRRLSKRYRRNPESFKSNPPLWQDIWEFVGPGFASFAATRFLTRVAATQLAKKKPSWGKHAGAVTSLAAFAAAWWGAHRVKWLQKHHTPIVVGAAIAALQSLIQLYIPRLGWMVADATPELESAESLQITDSTGDGTTERLAAGIEYLDEDPNEYTYNDAFDPGITTKPPAASTAPKSDDDIINELNMEEDDLSDLHLGSLGH